MNRRSFLKSASIAAAGKVTATSEHSAQAATRSKSAGHQPGRIPNEYTLLLPGEESKLNKTPRVSGFDSNSVKVQLGSTTRIMHPGDLIGGWNLVSLPEINGISTTVFETHVTHRGAILYVTESEGVIARIPKGIGDLSKIRPRPTNPPHGVKLERPLYYVPGPDVAGKYILDSDEDPCYENVAALGDEYIGWSLVANEDAGPLGSLFVQADGKSRQLNRLPEGQAEWAPDSAGALFDPVRFLPRDSPHVYEYVHGFSKRTLLGGYLPVADTGVWNPGYRAGYEVMLLLPPGTNAVHMARVRIRLAKSSIQPADAASIYHDEQGNAWFDRYQNCTPESFFSALVGIWNRWRHLFEDHLVIEVPDPWLLEAARAGIMLARCSYRGLEPTYQIGEGAYTKIPERSHALFPVAHYEFVWAHQLWNLTAEVEPYFQHYLDRYILPDGNFLYNTQDQVEAPLNTGIFVANSARAYDYGHDLAAFEKRLPILNRMLEFVLQRYEYTKSAFATEDPHHGLIWGSPEADLGDPQNDFPESHPLYYQNAAWTWRALREHSRCLARVAEEHNRTEFAEESKRLAAIADEMRGNIERSIRATIAAANPAMRQAGITPFTPEDTHRKPTQLESYENHRFMMDWFTSDWGDAALDQGHLRHREIAGEQIIGLHTDGAVPRTSNFMEHGTLAVRIRQDDYRPFLLTLYALVCYAADCGNRYSPEDAFLPGSFPGDGNSYDWSSVVNSVLQPALGLRWLLCYEENHREVCHLQKAAPKHWFASGQRIKVAKCPTRFGPVSWTTLSISETNWQVNLEFSTDFEADLVIHIHPLNGGPLRQATAGQVEGSQITLRRNDLTGKRSLEVRISS
ncbi:MAG: hypothetical protein JO061_17280 [Acidobacteriaceae bacterium]|nr:hypothetical protein [Acidobacteriaceae bacterium]